MTHPLDALSFQEERVIRLRAQGVSNKEVAGLLVISEQTVKNHMSNIYRKLNVEGIQGALLALGWVIVPDEGMDESARCSWAGHCGKQAGHSGAHGRFRPIDSQAGPPFTTQPSLTEENLA